MNSGDRDTSPGPLELLVAPLERWKLLAAVVFIAAAGAAIVSLVARPRYTATASFTPDGGEPMALPSGLASLAGSLGVGSVTAGASSPQFYADLVRTRAFVRLLLNATVPADTGMVSVLELLRIRESNPGKRIERGEAALRSRLAVSFDRVTRRVDIAAWMNDPRAAQALAESLLARVNEFDGEVRRTRAGTKRQFAVVQQARARDSLRAAERDMESFLERNRSFEQSPQLRFQYERLQRVILLRQDVFVSLSRELEQARLGEVDDRPVITVVDPPVVPATRSWPQRKRMVMTATVGAFVMTWTLMVVIRLLQEVWQTPETDSGRALRRVADWFGQRLRRAPAR